MKIDGNEYDITKFSKEIFKEEVVKDDKILGGIFDYLDNLDGNTDGKLFGKNLQNIFSIIEKMDNENGIADGNLSDNEISTFAEKINCTKDDLKNFIKKLLNINTKKINEEIKATSVKQKKEESKYDFKLGKKINGTRQIGPESVAVKRNLTPQDILSDRINSILIGAQETTNNNQTSNGGFAQGKRGDCYFLATINAIKNSKDGQKILDKTIKKNSDKSYTITLPGAVLLKNSLIKKGFKDKCEVTGVYKITPEAIEKLKQQSGKAYSSGNLKVMLLELAMESYRAELKITNENLKGLNDSSDWQTAEGSGSTHEEDNLWGGYTWDAGFLLTGEKANVYSSTQNKRDNLKLYKKGKYGFVTREQMEQDCLKSKVTAYFGQQDKGLSEISSLTSSENDLSTMLNNVKYKEDNYSITVSFRCEENGDDDVTQAGNYHALTVLRVTENTVYVLNPWLKDEKGSSVIEPIPRKDFEAMCSDLVIQKMDLEKINKTYEEISNPTAAPASTNNTNHQNLIQILGKLKYN